MCFHPVHAGENRGSLGHRQVGASAWALFLAPLVGACSILAGGADSGSDPPAVVASEEIPLDGLGPEVELDSLTTALLARADTLVPDRLPALETEIRDWLARLEYEDPALAPLNRDPGPYFRHHRGRLLDALGVAALRAGDLRQAEAALRSSVDEIHSRGTTTGYARHFRDLGDLLAARGRWGDAAEAYLAAEVRGMGERATPALEAAWRKAHGSLSGLDRARRVERARVEDERRQLVVAGIVSDPLPDFAWPRRTGPPLSRADLVGTPAVLAVWGPGCCPRWPRELEPLAARLARRGAALVGVWLGEDPSAAGPPAAFRIAVPPDPRRARRGLEVWRVPALLVVDAAGRIRYRHAGEAAVPLPVDDVILQIDHLERRRTGSAAPTANPAREAR